MLLALAGLGALLTLAGFLVSPGRTAAGILLVSQLAIGLAVGGLSLVVLTYVSKAGWIVAVRRVPEALAAAMPLSALLVLAAVACMSLLYEWSHAEVVAGDPVLAAKRAWLDPAFFLGRTLAYLAVWTVFAFATLRNSRHQDRSGDPGATTRNVRLSAGFLAALAVTWTFASFDWVMSLEPHWFSTVFAIYLFAGAFTSALAVTILVLVLLRRTGPLEGIVKDDHLHDLAKLLLGFSTFWAYIWFCQHMLIWYGNLPEETAFYEHRMAGLWWPLMVANLAIGWGIPFLVLLPRAAKRHEAVLLGVAGLILLARWLDLYLIVNPVFLPDGPRLGLPEVGPPLLLLPLLVLAIARTLARHPLVPSGDPHLQESLAHHT
jgi:hypothetical protein